MQQLYNKKNLYHKEKAKSKKLLIFKYKKQNFCLIHKFKTTKILEDFFIKWGLLQGFNLFKMFFLGLKVFIKMA